MKSGNKAFYVFLVLSVQLVLLSYGGNAWAVAGQAYTGDGAVNNPAVPPGGWLNNGLDGSCFACHNGSAAPPFSTAPNMTSYLMTGHKNAMRMVRTPPVLLTGTGGLAYTTDQYGNPFAWGSNTITILGFCTNPLFLTPSACTGGGGVWISGIKSLYYIFGGWMDEAPGALYDGRYTQVTPKTAVSFGNCARCHTTGFTMDQGFNPFRAPEGFFPGITWTPTDTSGKIDFDPDGNGPADRGSWQVVFSTGTPMGLEGVQCERCHDASNHFSSGGSVTRPRGTYATALCLECHRQDHVSPYAGGGLGANIVPTAFTDNEPPLPANEPLFALPAIEVGGPNGYEPGFYDYSIGMEFLNGAHAKFTGNFQQIADPTKYSSSAFQETLYSCSKPLYVSQSTCESNDGIWSSNTVQGGCTTCHEVHQSAVKAVNAAAPFKKQCTDCHAGAGTAPPVSVINHPSGAGTPLEHAGTEPSSPCQICHMPRLNQGSSSATHLFRINTDASYSTFPTESQWNSGQKTANTSPDGTFTDAVWNDVDMSCGQCHGVGGSAFHFPKAQLATVAAIIHSTDVSGIDCTLCHTTIVQSGPGQNHHSGTCLTCHGTSSWPLHQGAASPACATCHPTVNQGVNHHSGTCTSCHGAFGGVPTGGTCTSCHSSPTFQTLRWNMGTSITCASCHGGVNGGVKPVAGTTLCNSCHGGSGPGITLSQTEINTDLPNMHNNRPTANFSVGYGANLLTANVDGSSSVCPVGSCSYSWAWGDTNTSTGGPTNSHVYATAGTKMITLTVTDSGTGSTATKTAPFNAYATNQPPVANCVGGVIGWNANTWTASCTDASTDPDGTVVKRSMNWGDGGFINTCTTAPCVFTHTYPNPGVFGVTLTAFDNNGATGTLTGLATPAYFTLGGTVKNAAGTLGLNGATVTVRNATTFALVKTVVTSGTSGIPAVPTGAWTTGAMLKPGLYNIYVTKAGYTFLSPVVPVSVTIPIGVGPSNTTLDIRAQ